MEKMAAVTDRGKEDLAGQMANLQQAHRTALSEKNKYQAIFESLNSPVAVLDRNRRIDTVNPSWTALFGAAAATGAESDAEARIDPPAWLSKEIDRFVAGGQAETTLRKLVDTAIGRRHLSIKFKRLPDVDKQFCGCVIVLDDLTQREQAQAEASRNYERLQGVLELAGAVCHDMNQPLMAISGYAELILMECPTDAPYYQKLRKISEQAAKMGNVTKKLMHVARYETKTYLDQQIIDIEKSSSRS